MHIFDLADAIIFLSPVIIAAISLPLLVRALIH